MRLLPVFLVILGVGCKSEPPTYDKNKVIGQWVVVEAHRNNRVTQTVNGALFSISDKDLKHNLYGQDSIYQIIWGKESINTPGSSYKIESSRDSLLVLYTTLHNYPFRLSLKRVAFVQTEE